MNAVTWNTDCDVQTLKKASKEHKKGQQNAGPDFEMHHLEYKHVIENHSVTWDISACQNWGGK